MILNLKVNFDEIKKFFRQYSLCLKNNSLIQRKLRKEIFGLSTWPSRYSIIISSFYANLPHFQPKNISKGQTEGRVSAVFLVKRGRRRWIL